MLHWWYLATVFFNSASALSSIDHNDKNWMIERKRNQKLLSPSTIIVSVSRQETENLRPAFFARFHTTFRHFIKNHKIPGFAEGTVIFQGFSGRVGTLHQSLVLENEGASSDKNSIYFTTPEYFKIKLIFNLQT